MVKKKVIIIGGSTGIGREMALLYAAQDYLVAVTGRNKAALNELQKKFPKNIFISLFDVTESQNIQQVNTLIHQMDGLDLLIYNAGFGNPSLKLDITSELLTTKINVTGFVEIVAYAYTYFSEKGKGNIAVTSSIAAYRGNSWTPAYSASKAFISNYAEGLNIKAQKEGLNIVVTDIKPGFVNTKPAKGNKRFWVAAPHKAALQIIRAIEKNKRVVHITKRWWLIAQLLKVLPFQLYKKFL